MVQRTVHTIAAAAGDLNAADPDAPLVSFPLVPGAEAGLRALAEQVHQDLALLAYPGGNWVTPLRHSSGQHVYDVVVVGAGQSGMAASLHLKRDGVANLLLIDRSPAGFEGPWERFARMAVLRTPKYLVGTELGLPNLSARRWFETRYGKPAWEQLERFPRQDWMAYLRWYRSLAGLDIRNETSVEDIEPDGRIFAVRTDGAQGPNTVLARRLVLATGYDGFGAWKVLPHIAAALPEDRYAHSNEPIDLKRLAGKRIGILGHGASAFDAAVAALRHGAVSVDLCFRRQNLPTVNPHRIIEFGGFLKHYAELDDRIRWNVARHFELFDQPPGIHSFDLARAQPNFRMHAAAGWDELAWTGQAIQVRSQNRSFEFDFVICATGAIFDLSLRSELRPFLGDLARWRDRFKPRPEEDQAALGGFPYLGKGYELEEVDPGRAPWLRSVYAYNFSAMVSMGPHSTSVSGHKYSIPRLVGGLTRSLFLEQSGEVLPSLRAYNEPEIDFPEVAL